MRDNMSESLCEQEIGAGARCAGHRAGNSSDSAAEFVRMPGDGHRSRANTSLDDDGRCGERGLQACASEEAMARRHCAGWNLADHEAEVGYSLK